MSKENKNLSRSELISNFVITNPEYYIKEFKKIFFLYGFNTIMFLWVFNN